MAADATTTWWCAPTAIGRSAAPRCSRRPPCATAATCCGGAWSRNAPCTAPTCWRRAACAAATGAATACSTSSPPSRPDLDSGARDVNWGLYLQVPEAELAALLTDRLGRRSHGSVAAGMLAPDREAALKARAGELLPDVFAQVVDASPGHVRPGHLHRHGPRTISRGRVCLVGDAGTLHPPFTGSGVFKAITNALELAAGLRIDGDVDQALAAWDEVQLRTVATFAPAPSCSSGRSSSTCPTWPAFDDDDLRRVAQRRLGPTATVRAEAVAAVSSARRVGAPPGGRGAGGRR